MKKNNNCDLKTCFMCQLTLKEWHPAIESHKRNFIAKKGEVIIKEGDPVSGVYFVTSGNVKVHKQWGDKELILRFANDGAIIGHRGISSSISTYPISATALETTKLCFVDIDFFKTTIKVNQEFAYGLLMFYADELHASEKKMRNLALMSVKGRLAVAILGLRDQFGLDAEGFLNLALSRQDLAAFTGATYETVFRTMNELLAEKLIIVKGKQIGILNGAGLTDLGSK
ncbi:Crp/Fnr family transcriptional regulator [Pedobacter sp. Bi36]|uniref:Crp/Fnr family transcriptional regulator n=2 Tax=unclassified Pedobacter TaxID=2628915 RepID=UPI001D8C8C97|nr:Crp/Fnr family transcriptional regulator [Pedobacter sp. Bi36]CAH0153298.1 Transcriptional activator protein Anr [Pedobacter sp. Bi36]CAH0209525.1 Transcriptional activator protein Anr [Pedobacter sp. Bi126]